jgi:hypothetical protein
MPEAAVNKNNFSKPRKYQVGSSRQGSPMQSEAETEGVRE